MDFALIAQAGLTQREFAAYVGVTRVSVNLWVKDKMRPHAFIKGHVQGKLDNIAAAIKEGRLPLAQPLRPGPTPPGRLEALQAALPDFPALTTNEAPTPVAA